MKALSIGLSALLALAAGGAPPAAAAPAERFPFTCEIDLNQLTPGDAARVVPANQRGAAFLTTGEKKCTFSANANTDIKCKTRVQNWPNPRSVTISKFQQPCQWFLEQNQCNVGATIVAKTQKFQIKRIDSNTASLELSCSGKVP